MDKQQTENTVSSFKINTAFIVEELTNEQKSKYSAEVFQDIIDALESIICINEGHVHVELSYYGTKEQFEKEHPQYEYSFPHYFCAILELSEEMAVYPPVLYVYPYTHPYILSKGDDYFDFFFALQFSLLDKTIVNDFFNYQYTYNFDEKPEVFTIFLKKLCYDYEVFISKENKLYINKYISEIESHTNEQKESFEKTIKHKFETPVKAYSPKELYKLYEVSPKTFNSWLKPHLKAIGKLNGKRYTPKQVQTIFHLLAEP